MVREGALQQEKDKWYKFDYLFSWDDFSVQIFINHTLLCIVDFHMGVDPFASGQGKLVDFTGVDSLVLYTLTPGGKSESARRLKVILSPSSSTPITSRSTSSPTLKE